MSRSVFARFSAAVALVAQSLLVVAACLCAPALLGETAMTAPPPPCHQTESGLRMSTPDSCCCDEDGSSQPEATARVEAASISPVPVSPARSAATAVWMRSIPALGLSEPLRPRPPLRV